MTAPVRIDASAWGDLRFAALARFCGFADAEHALIKCARIWAWQTEHYTEDEPTYTVDPELVESALGPGGADNMVRAKLAEDGPSGLRIKGSLGRIEWLWEKRVASRKGGEATKRKHENKGRPTGPAPAQPQARPEAMPEAGPNGGPLTLSPDRSGSQNIHTHARERDPRAGAIARAVWKHGVTVRSELAASIAVVPPWALTVGTEHSGWTALLDRICELLVDSKPEEVEKLCRNRVDVAAAKARVDGDGNYFVSTTMFARNSFDTWAHLDPASILRKRAGPKRAEGAAIGAASPRNDHPIGDRLIPINEL